MRGLMIIAAALILGEWRPSMAHAQEPGAADPTHPEAQVHPDTLRDATTVHPAALDVPRDDPPQIDLGVGTVVPLYLGAQAQIEGPFRLLAGFEIGWMPKPYAHAIDDMLKSFGVYPDEVSLLIREALQSSLVLRPSIGWRPFPGAGFEFLVGYTYLSLGGGLSGREAIEAVTDRSFPNEAPSEIPLHSTLHNIHVQLSYRFMLGEHFMLRVSLAYLHTLDSSSGIDFEPRAAAGQRLVNEINARIDDLLDGYYTDYVHAPLLGLTAAYRL